MREYTRYWIFPQDGDPLPSIGSGFRSVLAAVGPSRVHIKGPNPELDVTITASEWNDLPHVENTGQDLATAVTALRRYKPTKPCEACKKEKTK